MDSWAHWKARIGLGFVLIELFLPAVTAEALRVNIDWKSAFSKWMGFLRLNFQVEGDVHHLSGMSVLTWALCARLSWLLVSF